MRKFFVRLLFFFITVLIVDYSFGLVCRYFIVNAKGGFTMTHEYIANHSTEDVLIFGSSRALHHYVPDIIEDSLGLTCYNCGVDGNGILYLYSRLQMILQRYTPKVIIYDISSQYDISSDDHMRYLGWQRRYCDIPGVSEVIKDIDKYENIKLNSNLYKYNGQFLQIIIDNFYPMHEFGNNGYFPLFSTMDYEPKPTEDKSIVKWDNLKKNYFVKFVELCRSNDIQLIVAYSPLYSSKSSNCYKSITDFCLRYEIPLLDFYADSYFKRNEFFTDASHMNDVGAKEYTRILIPYIRNILNNSL